MTCCTHGFSLLCVCARQLPALATMRAVANTALIPAELLSGGVNLCGQPRMGGLVKRVAAADWAGSVRKLLCFLLGHRFGAPGQILGVEVRVCLRCGKAQASSSAPRR
jgi:hypothetical protein